MRAYVVRDSDFTRLDGNPASYLLHYDAYGKRYLSAFHDVRIVGRLFHHEDLCAKPVEGEGVKFVAFPGFRGPMGLLRALPHMIRTISGTADRNSAYILRIPATISLLYSILLRLRRIPFAVEVAADPYDGYSSKALGNHPLAPLFRSLFVAATKWQCRTAAASAYVTAEALQRRYPPKPGAPTFNFTSIDLDDDAFVAAPRTAASFARGRLRLVMIGNMQKNLKGQDTLIDAVARLRGLGHDIEATIIGFGEGVERYKAQAGALGIAEYIHFTGRLQNGGPISNVLDACDLFVLPSRQEGLPRALLEAMARALPAFATRVGGTPEILDEPYLFEPNDTERLVELVKSVIDDPEKLARMSAASLTTARRYHVDEVSKARRAFFSAVRSLSRRDCC